MECEIVQGRKQNLRIIFILTLTLSVSAVLLGKYHLLEHRFVDILFDIFYFCQVITYLLVLPMVNVELGYCLPTCHILLNINTKMACKNYDINY